MRNRHDEDGPSHGVRARALHRMLITLPLAAAWIAFVMLLESRTPWRLWGPAIGVPVVPFLVFAVELLTGRTFGELSRRWNALAGWQRGVLGLGIVVVAFVLIMKLITAVVLPRL